MSSSFTNALDLDLNAFKEMFEKTYSVSTLSNIKLEHSEILEFISEQIQYIDFRSEAGFTDDDEKLRQRHFLIMCVDKVLELFKESNLGVCNNHGRVFLYNGEWWNGIEDHQFETFLGNSAEKMGVSKFMARLYTFREQLLRQFLSISDTPKQNESEKVMINLSNGTFEIDGTETRLRKPEKDDFMTYQLPFKYDKNAECPIFMDYLNTVLPDKEQQMIVAEYLGYLFIRPSVLKLEKSLILYGSGANGKSVLFEVVNALLGGSENVSNYSLQNLTNENGYYRAMLGNKLVNYASEINGKMDTAVFKQLVSGEPVDARLPYGDPFTITNYAKLIFNCNELPTAIENTNAFFRRFLIIPFNVTIPEEKQDKQLAQKIIKSELSGVLNWVLEGLERLLNQKNFTYSENADSILKRYKKESDTVELFLEEEGYEPANNEWISLTEIYNNYRLYCINCDYRPYNRKKFVEKIKSIGVIYERKSFGMAVLLKKEFGKTPTFTTSATFLTEEEPK